MKTYLGPNLKQSKFSLFFIVFLALVMFFIGYFLMQALAAAKENEAKTNTAQTESPAPSR